MKRQKMIKTWFKQLEEPYRTQALANIDKGVEKCYRECVEKALTSAFEWEKSPEGSDYWCALYDKLVKNNS